MTLFAIPRVGLRKEECFFYHVSEIPATGLVGEHWDLRETVDDYLGHYDFSGKTALDIGTASGYLTFEMEKRGADVVSFDVESARVTEPVPFHDEPFSTEELIASQEVGFDRLKNSYWFCHEALRSSAKAVYGNIHRIPAELGTFDAVVVGMCLPHIRDPLSALTSIAARSKKSVIVTQQMLRDDAPIMRMLASVDSPHREHIRHAWWLMSDGCLENFMRILGFKLSTKSQAAHKCIAYDPPRYEHCTTMVFDRI